MSLTLPAEFSLAHYHLTLQTLDPLYLPPFKGSALRGGFGHTFKRLVCIQPRACDKRCALGNPCPYGYIFETSPPDESEVLRNFQGVPRPFIIQPPDDRRTEIPPGERLAFGLILVGRAIKYLPYFIAVFRELGRAGLGRSRGRYRLLAVEAQAPFGDSPEPVYRADDELIRAPDSVLTGEAIMAHAATLRQAQDAALPPNRVTLNFLTPTRLKHRGRWMFEGPPFEVLIKTLLGRTSSLSYFHCGERLDVDFRGLIDRAADVRIDESETRWEDWERFSGRQKQRVKMGGLVGRVTYEGKLQDYLPLLTLGELIHVGKGTVFGNGQYRIEEGER